MKHHAFTAVILVAALALYAGGFAVFSWVAIAGGLVLEGWFWLRVVRSRDSSGDKTRS